MARHAGGFEDVRVSRRVRGRRAGGAGTLWREVCTSMSTVLAAPVDSAARARIQAVRRVFEQNVEERWKPLTTELASAALTEEQRALCTEIVTAGLTVAANL